MLPTFHVAGDVVLLDKLSKHIGYIRPGDVVACRSPTSKENVFKRVLGMEGERMYNSFSQQMVTVPKGHVWIQGDNEHNSTDSRHYGPVPYNLVEGRAICRIIPFSKFKWVENDASFVERAKPASKADIFQLESSEEEIDVGDQVQRLLFEVKQEVHSEERIKE